MHHLVFLNPRKGKSSSRKSRKGKMPAALRAYWAKKRAGKSSSPMKHRRKRRKAAVRKVIHRRRRRVHKAVRHVRRRRIHRAVRSRRRRSRHHRTKLGVVHSVRRVRANPPGQSMGGSLSGMISKDNLILGGSATAAIILNSQIVPKITAMLPRTASPIGNVLIADAIKVGLGAVLAKLIYKKSPAAAKGIMAGTAISVLLDFYLYFTQATPGALGVAAYLGGPRVGQRRMAAYLGRNGQARQMGAYLSPGQPIQSLVGPVSPARRTFGAQAGALKGIYDGTPAFKADAWSR